MSFNEFNTKKSLRKVRITALSVALASLFYFVESTALWAEEVAETAGEAKLDPLAWKGDLALWTAVVFLILLVVLYKFAFGPIVKALDQREKNELARVEAAERANADAKALLEEYRKKLADSGEEVRQIVSGARKEAERQADSIVETAKKAAANERERALKEIQTASDLALQDIAAKSAEMATTLAGKILKEQIDPSKHTELIKNAVGDIAKK